jgi:hypothetical protein
MPNEPGEVQDKPDQDEHEGMMDQCAREAMAAINANDHEGFRDSMHVLMADFLTKMSPKED